MPHKHKRSRRDDDDSLHDLPPTVIAKPLAPKDFQKQKTVNKKNHKRKRGNEDTTATETKSTTDSTTKNKLQQQQKKKKRQSKSMEDDTPKAFLRIMQQMQGKKLDRGPDDGNDRRSKKKQKGGKDDDQPAQSEPQQDRQQQQQQQQPKINLPKILPGEKLSDFAARVDQAMPLSGISKKGGSIPGLKLRESRTTKHEKHLRRLQKGWREEEARLRAKEEEEREEREAENEDIDEQWRALEAEAGPIKKRKGHKKNKGKAGYDSDEDGDPWAKLNKKAKEQMKNPLETVDAPPTLTKISRPKFKVYGGASVNVENVPNKAGSLRRREELKEEREGIVEQYRRLMAEKRAGMA